MAKLLSVLLFICILTRMVTATVDALQEDIARLKDEFKNMLSKLRNMFKKIEKTIGPLFYSTDEETKDEEKTVEGLQVTTPKLMILAGKKGDTGFYEIPEKPKEIEEIGFVTPKGDRVDSLKKEVSLSNVKSLRSSRSEKDLEELEEFEEPREFIVARIRKSIEAQREERKHKFSHFS